MKIGVKSCVTATLFLLSGPNFALAETAYVTDQLRLSIHEAPDTSDAAFASLLSGEKIDILEQNIYYAKVKMEDGRIGWVRKTYLVKDPPAVRLVKDLQTERDGLAATTKRLQDEVIDAKTRLKELEGDLSDGSRKNLTEAQELRELRKEQNALTQKLAAYRLSLPAIWVVGIAVGTLLLGLWFGSWLADYRNRKRHGGFRV